MCHQSLPTNIVHYKTKLPVRVLTDTTVRMLMASNNLEGFSERGTHYTISSQFAKYSPQPYEDCLEPPNCGPGNMYYELNTDSFQISMVIGQPPPPGYPPTITVNWSGFGYQGVWGQYGPFFTTLTPMYTNFKYYSNLLNRCHNEVAALGSAVMGIQAIVAQNPQRLANLVGSTNNFVTGAITATVFLAEIIALCSASEWLFLGAGVLGLASAVGLFYNCDEVTGSGIK